VIAQQLQHLLRFDTTAVKWSISSCNTCSAPGKTAVRCLFSNYSKSLALRGGSGSAGVLHHTCEQDRGERLLVPSLLSGPPRGAHRAGWHKRKALETDASDCFLALKLAQVEPDWNCFTLAGVSKWAQSGARHQSDSLSGVKGLLPVDPQLASSHRLCTATKLHTMSSSCLAQHSAWYDSIQSALHHPTSD